MIYYVQILNDDGQPLRAFNRHAKDMTEAHFQVAKEIALGFFGSSARSYSLRLQAS